MKKRLYIIIILALVLLFSIMLGIYLDGTNLQVSHERALTLLWASKVVGWVMLIGIGIYIFINKGDFGNAIILVVSTSLFQLVPLILRLFLRGDNPNFVMALIVSFVSVIIYFSLFIFFDLSNDKLKKTNESAE